jgi:hypothetical protein
MNKLDLYYDELDDTWPPIKTYGSDLQHDGWFVKTTEGVVKWMGV